jgi:hypothetical protein
MILTKGKYHFFFGDETGIRLFNKARREIRFPEKQYIGVLEMEECYKDLPEQLGLLTDVVHPNGSAAARAIHFLHTLDPEVWNLWKDGIFHLAGRWNIVLPFRKELTKMGIPDERIVTYPAPVKSIARRLFWGL